MLLRSLAVPLILSVLVLSVAPSEAGGNPPADPPAARTGPPDLVPPTVPPSEVPAWVASSRALEPGGFRRDLFTEHASRSLDVGLRAMRGEGQELIVSRLRAAPEGCTIAERFGEHQSISPLPKGSLEELSTHAEAIYEGVVVDRQEGFLGGRAGSLMALGDLQVLKEPETEFPSDRLLLHYPYARIEVDGGTWCRVDRRFPDHPESGLRVLVFVFPHRYDDQGDHRILLPEDGEIFFEVQGDKTSVPDSFDDPRFDPARSLDYEGLVEQTRLALQAAEDS